MRRSVNIKIVQEEECTEEMALLSGVTGGEEVGEVETSLSNLNLGQNITMVLKLRSLILSRWLSSSKFLFSSISTMLSYSRFHFNICPKLLTYMVFCFINVYFFYWFSYDVLKRCFIVPSDCLFVFARATQRRPKCGSVRTLTTSNKQSSRRKEMLSSRYHLT